jgi:small subunit ribosomal protein S1
VLEVDREKQRISLGVKQLTEDPWLTAIPEHYKPGMVVRGAVTKITNFGVFVELEADLEGLLHISELADHKVENPQDVVKAGDEVDVKILRVDKRRSQDRSLAQARPVGRHDTADPHREAREGPRASQRNAPTRGGMDDRGHGAMGTDKIRFEPPASRRLRHRPKR